MHFLSFRPAALFVDLCTCRLWEVPAEAGLYMAVGGAEPGWWWCGIMAVCGAEPGLWVVQNQGDRRAEPGRCVVQNQGSRVVRNQGWG